MRKKLAIVRGKFLNAYEMQIFEPLAKKYAITAFGSKTSYHSKFSFPTVTLPSPMDLPEFPFKLPILNRAFVDAHYLFGLEKKMTGFDIVHTAETYFHYTQQSLQARKRGYVKKVVATVLENIPFNNEGILGRKDFKRTARNELDHIIALTKRTRDALILEGANPKKISVVSHGINTDRFTPRDSWLKGEKDKKKFTVLFSGRLEEYKGIFEMLYAAKFLLSDKSLREYGMNFVFVGTGSKYHSMIKLEKKLNIDKFITHKSVPYDRMPREYQRADLFWAPSKPTFTYQEQYCTALLEAQATGLPIVTTLSGGIPENIGTAGKIVEPGDFYSLKEVIKQYITHPLLRVHYANKARERALHVHDVKIIAKKLDTIYESLV